MSDIVERLRDGTDDGDLTIVGEQCLEAADEIERLRADLKTAFEESWKARAKVTELERELTKANERTKELEAVDTAYTAILGQSVDQAKQLAAERAVSDKLLGSLATERALSNEMLNSICALGVVGAGYCFCSHERDPDKSEHEPECADLRTLITEARLRKEQE